MEDIVTTRQVRFVYRALCYARFPDRSNTALLVFVSSTDGTIWRFQHKKFNIDERVRNAMAPRNGDLFRGFVLNARIGTRDTTGMSGNDVVSVVTHRFRGRTHRYPAEHFS
jgi:hypothetical protein